MRQHVIDPMICVACLSCLPVCPSRAIVAKHGVVAIDPDLCAGDAICIAECTTGAIESWIEVPAAETFSLDEQFEWTQLPGPALG